MNGIPPLDPTLGTILPAPPEGPGPSLSAYHDLRGQLGGPSDYYKMVCSTPVGSSDPAFADLCRGIFRLDLLGQYDLTSMSVLTFNLQALLVVWSPDWDPGQPFRTDDCSQAARELCRRIDAFRGLSVTPLPDDPGGIAGPRLLWAIGADYDITEATGQLAGLVGGRLHAVGPFLDSTGATHVGFFATAVPEPATALLLTGGVTVLAARRRSAAAGRG